MPLAPPRVGQPVFLQNHMVDWAIKMNHLAASEYPLRATGINPPLFNGGDGRK